MFPAHFLASGSSDKPSLWRDSLVMVLKCSLRNQQHWHRLVTPQNHWTEIHTRTGVPAIPVYVEVWGALHVQHVPQRTLCCRAEEHSGGHFKQRGGSDPVAWSGGVKNGHVGGARTAWTQRSWKIKICSHGQRRNGLYSFGKNHSGLFGSSNDKVQLVKSKN